MVFRCRVHEAAGESLEFILLNFTWGIYNCYCGITNLILISMPYIYIYPYLIILII